MNGTNLNSRDPGEKESHDSDSGCKMAMRRFSCSACGHSIEMTEGRYRAIAVLRVAIAAFFTLLAFLGSYLFVVRWNLAAADIWLVATVLLIAYCLTLGRFVFRAIRVRRIVCSNCRGWTMQAEAAPTNSRSQ